jgi:3D (Asp-Asp-Asp) domain-containing protein
VRGVPRKLARRGCSETDLKAAFLRLSVSRIACSTRDSTTSEQRCKIMKLFCAVIFLLSLASAAFAREESILARVTSYWADEGSEYASTRRRLRPGHCAVDPKRIPYGSKVIFSDAVCTAVDTGTAVIVARPFVYVDALQANSRPSWSTDFSKPSEKRTGGRMRIPNS